MITINPCDTISNLVLPRVAEFVRSTNFENPSLELLQTSDPRFCIENSPALENMNLLTLNKALSELAF